MNSWIELPLLLALPPLVVAYAFHSNLNRIKLSFVVMGFLVVVLTTVFGLYGRYFYCLYQFAAMGAASSFYSPEVRGAGIFVSWASSLPILFLLKLQIEALREGNFYTRFFSTFVIFVGVHLLAAIVFDFVRTIPIFGFGSS